MLLISSESLRSEDISYSLNPINIKKEGWPVVK